jgi:RNA polymerase sigma-70 factor (ECF subfamily)
MASERKLIRSAINGNKSAFGKLVELYQDQILYLIYDYLGDYEVAKDAAQDVFLKAYKNLNQFNQKAAFKTWLYKIAVNTSLDYLRKRISMAASQNDIQSYNYEIFNQDFKIDVWDDIFKNALRKLSEKQYSALVLKYFHDKSTQEISEILECDINTVRIHLHRGISKLKEIYMNSEKQ